MNGKKPTVISLFSGCGGSSLGYINAGFKELLAVDFNESVVKVFKMNFPKVPIWKKDIQSINAEDIMSFCGIKQGELDILDASPPCQGFSTFGKREVFDSRNNLYKDFARLVRGLQPKVFIMENVSGLVKGTMKGKFKEIMISLKQLNYRVKCKLMNSKHYGIPQSRERLIFLGVRKDLKIEPSYPKPSTKLVKIKNVIDLNTKEFLSQKELNKIKKHEYKQRLKGNMFQHLVCPNRTEDVMRTITKTRSSNNIMEINGKYRYPTLSELKRFCSFPEDFKFTSYNTAWSGMGNAVMPKFMEILAKHIKNNLLKIN